MTDEQSVDATLSAPIPILSNKLILKMMQAEKVQIAHFDGSKLAPTAYQLTAYRLRFLNDDEDGIGPPEKVLLLKSGNHCGLRPGEHVIVSPQETFLLADGFIADFYPSSWCVERRLLLTAGRLDANYNGELVFGLFNAGRYEVNLHENVQIARASIGWLGTGNIPAYEERVAGAYIPQLEKLRERSETLEELQRQIDSQKSEVAKLIRQLEQHP